MDGRTLVCGVIANPVAHSMSPVLQNLYAQRTGVNLAYVPFKVEPDMLQEMIQGAYAMNILGLNVTVPFKSQVMPFLKEIDETAEDIGAVNTLIRIDGGYKGYKLEMKYDFARPPFYNTLYEMWGLDTGKDWDHSKG